MLGNLQVVTFDTSAHNRLAEKGAVSESIFEALKLGYHFRFAGLSLEEIMSTRDQARRLELMACCGRLRHGSSDCLAPHYVLLKRMIRAHKRNPSAFDWKSVDVRALDFENEIARPRFSWDDALAEEQRTRQMEDLKAYEQLFKQHRAEFTAVFEKYGEPLPTTFRDVMTRLDRENSSIFWARGKRLYDTAAGTDISEFAIREFIGVCPPFRALLYATMLSWYDLAIRDVHIAEKFQSGRNDLYMSVYLPFCDKFVTAEKKGEQQKCLREIASLADLQMDVLSYEDFCNSFLVSA